MKNIGQAIKYTRISKNISQEDLSNGICSVSYLSKIENNKLKPNQIVIEKLTKKLNISGEDLSTEEEINFIFSLFTVYKNAILRRNIIKINEVKEAFFAPPSQMRLDTFYTYKLYSFRIMVVLKEYDKLPEEMKILNRMKKNFDLKQKFLFNINKGLYYYFNEEILKAVISLEESLEFIHNLNLEEWELADFYNILSTCYLKFEDINNTIKYAVLALKHYKVQQVPERIFDLNINLGIAWKKKSNYELSLKHFNKAKDIAFNYKIVNFEGILYQNLGSLYALQNKHSKAIEYYEISLKAKTNNEQIEKSLITTLCIIQEYSKQKNSDQVRKWCKFGLDLIKSETKDFTQTKKRIYHSYFFHFSVYLSIHKSEDIEKTLSQAISYFEENKNNRYTQKYSIMLGNYYYNQSKFEKAAYFFRKSNKVLLNQRKLKSLEDY